MKNELIGGLLIYIMLLVIEMFDLIRVLILIMLKGSRWNWLIYWIMNVIFPSLNSKRFISILMQKSSKNFCELIENDPELLSKIGFTKELKENHLSQHMICIVIEIVLLFVLLCLIDLNSFQWKSKVSNEDEFDENEVDEDVLNERNELLSRTHSLSAPFISMDLVKRYPRKESLAINHLTFSIEEGECFALLGFNGAGNDFSFVH